MKVKDINFTESDDEVQVKSEQDSKYELRLKAEEYQKQLAQLQEMFKN